MKKTTKIPKTFLISAESPRGKCGYIRFVASVSEHGRIQYRVKLVEKTSDASRFVGGENSKKKAAQLKERFRLSHVEVIDETSKRRFVIS